ncbi:hypothetical protein [Leptospira neocaledonica]|nr:hypothetical protein [Leptospira neocaledonica]
MKVEDYSIEEYSKLEKKRLQETYADIEQNKVILAYKLVTLSSQEKKIAHCDLIINRDVEKFRSGLLRSLAAKFAIYERYVDGDLDYARGISHLDGFLIFDCMLIGKKSLSKKMATYFNLEDRFTKSEANNPAFRMGLLLKYYILEDAKNSRSELQQCINYATSKSSWKNYAGYFKLLKLLVEESRDLAVISEALGDAADSFKKLKKGSGVFSGLLEGMYDLWTIAFLNLFKENGIDVDLGKYDFPKELVSGYLSE